MRTPFHLLAAAAALTAPLPAMADTLVDIVSERVDESVPMPLFKADAAWPRLPEDIILGQSPGLAVDSQDTIWVLTRPNSLDPTESGLAQDRPSRSPAASCRRMCCASIRRGICCLDGAAHS